MPKAARWPLFAALVAGGVVLGDAPLRGQAPPVATSVPRELTSYRDLVKQALPAVVSIESKGNNRRIGIFPGGPAEGPRENTLGAGSGVIVDAAGTIVTNFHVVDEAESLEITLYDGRKFSGIKDIKKDRNTDLAVVRIKSDTPLPYLPFGDSTQMEIGDRVLAIGSPFGLKGTVTHGIVSAKGRDLNLNRYDDFLQTDAAINPGNSGGPLINLAGQVIGINSAIKTAGSGGFQGVGLAIPSNMAKKVMTQLLKDGEVKRGYFGVNMYEDLTPEVAAVLGVPKGGSALSFVVPNSPAGKAGLQPDDVVTTIGAQPIHEQRELTRVVGELAPGDSVDVEVIRDGKPVKLQVTIGTLKGEGAEAARFSVVEDAERVPIKKFGLTLMDAKSRRGESGAFVVGATGAASSAGILQGMTVVRVNRKAVANAAEAKTALEEADANAGVLVHLMFTSKTGTGKIALLKAAK